MSKLLLFVFVLPPILFLHLRHRSKHKRRNKIRSHEEHVLILGASSGVGRALALQYAQRGAQVCLVARNRDGLERAKMECEDVLSDLGEGGKEGKAKKVFTAVADFSNAVEMVKVRERVEAEWGRLDTLAVIAGVSSLKPVLATAGIEYHSGGEGSCALPDPSIQCVQESVRIANAALQGNFVGPFTAAVTLIPLLKRTSPSPSILLLSSVAAVIPAPTRALYCASKSASLLLYESLAIEHPEVSFSAILPATIEGDFRASAIDGGAVREADPSKNGLKREVVARRCIQAIDNQEHTVFMPGFFRFVPSVYYLLSNGIVERGARKKYGYP